MTAAGAPPEPQPTADRTVSSASDAGAGDAAAATGEAGACCTVATFSTTPRRSVLTTVNRVAALATGSSTCGTGASDAATGAGTGIF